MFVPLSYNLRSLFVRRSATLLTVLGIGATVAIVSGVIALQQGFATMFTAGGRSDVAVFLRPGANSEGDSQFSRDRGLKLIKSLPEIEVSPEGPVASMEAYLAVLLAPVRGGVTNVPLRGVQPMSFVIRKDELHVIENELPANVMSHAPVSPLPRSPVTLALLPVTVPDPLAPSSHSTERLQLLLCVTSHDVLVHEPLSFQRPLKSFAQPLAPVPTVVDVHATITAQAPSVTTMPEKKCSLRTALPPLEVTSRPHPAR